MLVTVTESVQIARPPEVVWDFTQDYGRRAQWDPGILEAEVLASAPALRVRVRAAGGLRGVFVYKLFDRPRRTSVVLDEVESPLLAGGGGSWSYEARDGGTWWTQTNSLRFKSRFWFALLGGLVRRQLRNGTRKAMHAAKRMIEAPS
jgi:hypothetical protein